MQVQTGFGRLGSHYWGFETQDVVPDIGMPLSNILKALSVQDRQLTWYLSLPWEKNPFFHLCPGLNANEIQIPYDKHHKVSSLVKRHQNTHNSVKYEVI